MDRRVELQTLLETIAGKGKVFFQPPPSVQIKYPAIIYSRTDINDLKADNMHYNQRIAYELTIVDSDPECEFISRIMQLDYCKFTRHYVSNNLNHDCFIIYY